MSSKPLLLLTDPAHFEVSYRINPWMQPCAWAEDPAGHLAAARAQLPGAGNSAQPLPGPGLRSCPALRTCRTWCFPPMRRWCSTAVRWSRDFATPNAQREEQHFQEQFPGSDGARVLLEEVAQFPATCFQEGAGDCIWDATRGRFWAGYGQRSTRQAADEVAAFFGREVTALELVSPRFYHLDVCFCPLSGGEILYYPPAFSAASLAAIRDVVAS